MNHANLPEDRIPYWDFDAPSSAETPRDASAAAEMLCSLSGPQYRACAGENSDFILKHSTINWNKDNYDTAVVYADYYYIEALIRYLDTI